MTVQSTTNRIDYTGNGVLLTYPYDFKIFADEDLDVYVASSLQTLDVDYTVTGAGSETGGNVVFVAAPGDTLAVAIIRNLDITQETDYVELDKFPAETHEDALDKLTMIAQQFNESLGRSLKFGISSTFKDVDFPDLVASQFLQVNSAGTALNFVTGTPAVSGATFLDGSDFNAYWYDSSTYASINAAITAIGATVATLVVSSAETLTGNLVVPATLNLVIQKGGSIVKASTYTVTINGPFWAGEYTVFSGFASGDVKFGGAGLREVLPDWWGASTSADNAVPIQSAFSCVADHTATPLKVKFTKLFMSAAAINIYQNTMAEGGSRRLTGILFSHTGDGIKSTWTIDSSNAVNIFVKDMLIKTSSGASTGGGFVDVGGTFVHVEGCRLEGFAHGIIFDQTEISNISGNEFITNSIASVWLVNGDEHTALASGLYTNQITIDRNNQFNGGAVGVADDGGTNHVITENNFNAGTIGVRVNQVNNLLISGNEFESQSAACILFAITKIGTEAGSRSTTATVESNLLYPDTGMPAIDCEALSINRVNVTGNAVFTSSTAFNGMLHIYECTLMDNAQIGAGDPDYLLNNYTDGQNFVAAPVWAGSAVNPVIGNGSINAKWSRKGNEVTVSYKIVMGTTTTYGTGNYSFSLPFQAAAGVMDFQGTGMIVDATGSYTSVVPLIVQGGVVVYLYYTGGVVGTAAPITFADTDQIMFTIKYLLQVTPPADPDPITEPDVNRIIQWSNVNYDTFVSSGSSITSAIYSVALGTKSANTGMIMLTHDQPYTLTITVSLTSGALPSLTWSNGGTPVDEGVLSAGVNTISITPTAANPWVLIALSNAAAANWSCTATLVATP